jgi:hypothetical protein
MKSLETQLHEAQQEIRKLQGKDSLNTVAKKLAESGLPKIAQERLAKRLQSAGIIEERDIQKAIAEEHDYVRQVQKASGKKTTRTSESNAQTSDELSLVECYQTMGLTLKEAQVAAGVETTVVELKESRKKLHDAGKSLGLTDAEADAFSTPPQGPGLSW